MVSVTSVSRYITSTSRYNPRYQSRSSMYILWNFAELAEIFPMDYLNSNLIWRTLSGLVDVVIASDHPRGEASRVIQWYGLIHDTWKIVGMFVITLRFSTLRHHVFRLWFHAWNILYVTSPQNQVAYVACFFKDSDTESENLNKAKSVGKQFRSSWDGLHDPNRHCFSRPIFRYVRLKELSIVVVVVVVVVVVFVVAWSSSDAKF